MKLLYDIYHMQIMEGDVIRTMRDNRQWIAHFHTGGVPGRHEIDDTQELNSGGVPGDSRDRVHRLRGARVRADARPAHFTARGGKAGRRVTQDIVCSDDTSSLRLPWPAFS